MVKKLVTSFPWTLAGILAIVINLRWPFWIAILVGAEINLFSNELVSYIKREKADGTVKTKLNVDIKCQKIKMAFNIVMILFILIYFAAALAINGPIISKIGDCFLYILVLLLAIMFAYDFGKNYMEMERLKILKAASKPEKQETEETE